MLYVKNGTSEAIRDGVVVNSENVKRVSDHVPKHLKPLNDEQLGYYLAGLIDGHGRFYNGFYSRVSITFQPEDVSLAYYIKKQIGYGSIIKSRYWTHFLDVTNKEGLLRVINLINGKIKNEHVFNSLVNFMSDPERKNYPNLNITMDTLNNLDNHWLAGFCDVYEYGLFQLRGNPYYGTEIGLNFRIKHYSSILSIVKDYLGGNIEYNKVNANYYYNTVSMGSCKKVINYFDKYHLQSKKHIGYLRWRKAYRLIQDKEHLTEKGIAKLCTLYNFQIDYNMTTPSFRAF